MDFCIFGYPLCIPKQLNRLRQHLLQRYIRPAGRRLVKIKSDRSISGRYSIRHFEIYNGHFNNLLTNLTYSLRYIRGKIFKATKYMGSTIIYIYIQSGAFILQPKNEKTYGYNIYIK